MALPSSGTISISQIVTEFGGSAPHSLSEYYRNGGLVSSNNTSVPTSGTISMSNFYGAVNEIGITQGSATNINLSTVFGGNWSSSVPKRLTINSGTTIGGSGAVAMTIPSGMGGTLIIDNAGLIVGFGGAANSGAGGTAISNATSGVTINNTGTIAGGGGGGGAGGGGGTGGQGGPGSFSSTTTQTFSNCNAQFILQYDPQGFNSCRSSNGKHNIYAPSWGINIIGYFSFPYSYGGWVYTKGSSSAANCGIQDLGDSCEGLLTIPIRSQTTTTSTTGGAGGSGGGSGAGGRGQGYNQTAASGSGGSAGAAGSAGGTSAGAGGQGGTGGTGGAGSGYGAGGNGGGQGNTGATGAAGNAGGGSAGAAGSFGTGGGAAGAAVSGTSVTMNNSGSIFGAVA